MLSHLVWAANRADFLRLQQLEADNVLLAATSNASCTTVLSSVTEQFGS
jgi:hypothetical protein